MSSFLRRIVIALSCAGALICSGAQGAAAGPGEKLPSPTVLPLPGTYSNTTSITLMDAVPGTEIHYTWDGSIPDGRSPVFDPRSVLFIAGLYDGNRGLKTGYTLRAVAMKAGSTSSDPATFLYQIDRRDRTAYISQIVAPGVRMIRDSDNDKMYLVRGTKRYALIDSGMGRGELRHYIKQFTHGLPLVAIWTHSHPDHIGQADQFIASSVEYIGAGDLETATAFLERRGVSSRLIAEHLRPVSDGATIDLGDRALEIITVPGHTPGSIVILDPATGDLFTGDSFGNNSYLPPDVMWMQWSTEPLDEYFSAVLTARARLRGRVRLILTGHNDHPLVGARYLDNLEAALQRAMNEGRGALIPSWRPPGIEQIVVGDRFTDPNWFGINVNAKTFLPAPPDQIASLVLIRMQGASLDMRFSTERHDYQATVHGTEPVTISVRPASSRVRSISIDGRAAKAGAPQSLPFNGHTMTVQIVVTAHDGRTTQTYRVMLVPGDARR